jgi:hypothetical protein
MTKREKFLGGMLLLILVVLAHVFVGVSLKKRYVSQTAELDGLKTTYRNYSMMEDTAAIINQEVEWVNEHAPPVKSFQNAQTDLQNFLTSSSKALGFDPDTQKLLTSQEDEVIDSMYQSVKIQIAAKATEKQIYQWLVEIHQPEKMRILKYLKLTPPEKDSALIQCEIIAEQFISSE